MKKIVLFLMAYVMAVVANAQQTTVEGSKFFDNTWVGATVGGQVGMDDMIGHHNWTVFPDFNIYAGKWLTPTFGFEVNGEMVLHDGFRTADKFVDASYVGLNGKLNLNNVFHTYRGVPDRVEFIPFAGLGWLHTYGDNEQSCAVVGRNALASKMGVDVVFNLGQSHTWTLNVRPTVLWALCGNAFSDSFNKHRSRVGLEVGFTYKFGHKNSRGLNTHNFTTAYTGAEYDAALQNAVAEPEVTYVETVREVVVERVVENVVESYVFTNPHFYWDNTMIDPTSVVALENIAKNIILDGGQWTVTGYASEEGSLRHNTNLSLKRAEAVRDILVRFGVNPENVDVVAGGPTTKFGDTLESNRVVTIEKN